MSLPLSVYFHLGSTVVLLQLAQATRIEAEEVAEIGCLLHIVKP
jgi:hypothetical protein